MARLLPACLLLLLLALAAIALVAPTARAEPVERETANGVVFEDVVDATDNGEEDTAALSISSKSSHAKTSDDDDDTKDSDEDAEDSDKYEETTRVLQLGSDSFLDLLDSASNIAVVFLEGTSGCHSCALSIQLFEELAEDAKWDKIEFAVFDCQKDSSICSRYSVEQYPTIKLFNEGMGVYDYAQPVLSTALLEEFLTVYTGPKFTDITTTEELSRLSEHFISVVYFRKEDDSKLSGTFERTAAELFERLTFFRVAVAAQTAELLQDYNVTAGDFILVRNPPAKFSARLISRFEEPTISRSKLRDWVKSNFALPVMNFAVTEFSSAAALGLPLVVAHVSYADQELVDNTLNLLWQLQAKFPQRFVFGIIDITREDPLSLQRLGLYDTSKPAFLVHSMRGSHKFTGDVASFAALEAWVTAYSQGRLLRQPIRQPVPKTPEFINGVQTLVHDNFRSIVFDEEKDAVVFFYLPESSCEPCKTLLPIYEQVAQEFAKWSESIVFGKINMYLNEASPGVHVSNFPTIKYFAADLKNKEFTFSGPRTLENMRQFILNSSSFELQTDDAQAAAAAEAPQGGVNSPDIVQKRERD